MTQSTRSESLPDQPAGHVHPETPDPLHARSKARLNALESEVAERDRFLQWVSSEGGFDRFLDRTLMAKGALHELRGLLHPDRQDKAA